MRTRVATTLFATINLYVRRHDAWEWLSVLQELGECPGQDFWAVQADIDDSVRPLHECQRAGPGSNGGRQQALICTQ